MKKKSESKSYCEALMEEILEKAKIRIDETVFEPAEEKEMKIKLCQVEAEQVVLGEKVFLVWNVDKFEKEIYFPFVKTYKNKNVKFTGMPYHQHNAVFWWDDTKVYVNLYAGENEKGYIEQSEYDYDINPSYAEGVGYSKYNTASQLRFFMQMQKEI